MTQRERVWALLEKLNPDKVLRLYQQLDVIVGEAQNEPPQGESDGSISEMEWNAFRSLTRGLADAADGLFRARLASDPHRPRFTEQELNRLTNGWRYGHVSEVDLDLAQASAQLKNSAQKLG